MEQEDIEPRTVRTEKCNASTHFQDPFSATTRDECIDPSIFKANSPPSKRRRISLSPLAIPSPIHQTKFAACTDTSTVFGNQECLPGTDLLTVFGNQECLPVRLERLCGQKDDNPPTKRRKISLSPSVKRRNSCSTMSEVSSVTISVCRNEAQSVPVRIERHFCNFDGPLDPEELHRTPKPIFMEEDPAFGCNSNVLWWYVPIHEQEQHRFKQYPFGNGIRCNDISGTTDPMFVFDSKKNATIYFRLSRYLSLIHTGEIQVFQNEYCNKVAICVGTPRHHYVHCYAIRDSPRSGVSFQISPGIPGITIEDVS